MPSPVIDLLNAYLRPRIRSLSRKFRASDGREYRWQHQSIDGHEWTVRMSVAQDTCSDEFIIPVFVRRRLYCGAL